MFCILGNCEEWKFFISLYLFFRKQMSREFIKKINENVGLATFLIKIYKK